jgi:hypothetical protein
MAKLNALINALKLICVASFIHDQLSGQIGFTLLNIGTIPAITLLYSTLHLRFFMDILQCTLALTLTRIVLHLSWMIG